MIFFNLYFLYDAWLNTKNKGENINKLNYQASVRMKDGSTKAMHRLLYIHILNNNYKYLNYGLTVNFILEHFFRKLERSVGSVIICTDYYHRKHYV